MSTNILDDARLFLIHSLQAKGNGFESRHPWRKGWEFAVLHSLRVELYTTKILAREHHHLSESEVTLLRLAAILHDIGRLERRENHAQLGSEIAEKWLKGFPDSALQNSDIVRVVEMIADHSYKAVLDPDYSKAVLKDADTLDEIGVMSIFMSGNWVETHSPFFFYNLRQRLIDFEIPFFERKLAILNTNGAKEIMKEKKTFVENFIVQITDELQIDPRIEQMLFDISKSDTKERTDGEQSYDG
jgi:uncharacterized protein